MPDRPPPPPRPAPLCNGWPTDQQTRKAKRFGEGFTWTCPSCGLVMALAQGKGKYWYWKRPGAHD